MNWEDKIIDYFNNELSTEEQSLVERQLIENPELQQQFDDYAILMKEVDMMPLDIPQSNGKEKLLKLIEAESDASKDEVKIVSFTPNKISKYIAAIAAILILSIMIGTNYMQRSQIGAMDQQLAEVHAQMIQQLKSPSVSERIEGMQVQFVSHRVSTLPIVETLLETLQKDESPNVRLAALDALDRYMDIDDVRTTIIHQLSNEQDEFVLIAMIEALSTHHATDAIDPLRKLSTSVEVPKYVKDEAHWGLVKLERI